MKRDLKQLAERKFDLAVIGTGVHGATIAYLSAVCGLSVALLDKGDFCAGTSANSLKIIHGGLRYLQHMDVPRIKDSIISRRWMLANFPGLVKPLQCIMPTTGYGVRSKLAMSIGLTVNDIFSCTRNKAVPPENHIGRGKTISQKELLETIPGLDGSEYSGGALWYDALALNTERIVLEMVNRLTGSGGIAANYVHVSDISRKGGKAACLSCRDMESDEEFVIEAEYVVNTTGPLYTQFSGLKTETVPFNSGWSRAINLIVDPVYFPDHAVGLEGKSSFVDRDAVIQKGKRLFFFVPWRGKTMIGTVYSQYDDPGRPPTVSREDMKSIISEINQIYPAAKLSVKDICNYHVGLVPSKNLEGAGSFDVCLDKKEVVVDHGSQGGMEKTFSVKTVKYTTAFTVAREILNSIAAAGWPACTGWKEKIANAMSDRDESAEFATIPQYLLYRYGRQAKDLIPYLSKESLEETGDDNARLDPGEVRYAIEQEMALHLDDVLFRRIGVASVEKVPYEITEMAGALMAEALGWDDARLAAEVERVTEHFQPLES